jgi:uncharacterized protein
MNTIFDKAGLVALLRREFRLDWLGMHGAPHWARVRHHGRHLARVRRADAHVVELFALLHDSQRHNDWHDPLHGHRAAEFSAALNGRFFDLSASQLDRLTFAMIGHSDGRMALDATVQCCWDADRLDLGRVGITPSAALLSREAAERIEYALRLSQR